MITPIASNRARRCIGVSHVPQSALRLPVVTVWHLKSTIPNAGGIGWRHLKQ